MLDRNEAMTYSLTINFRDGRRYHRTGLELEAAIALKVEREGEKRNTRYRLKENTQ